MKRSFHTFIALSAISILSILLIGSCKKLDHNYRQFVDNGETIYIGKADSIVVRGGDNRAEVSWLLLSDPKVSHYKFFWNNGRDSIENSVVKTDNVDTIRVMLDNMSEGTHHFEIMTFDKYGNSSVPARASGKVYGEQYQRTILNGNRTVRALQREGRDLSITWMPAEATLAGVELEYINGEGTKEVHSIPSALTTYILPDFPENGTFKHRSLFLPDTLALDTFYTDFEETQIDDRMLTGRNVYFTTEMRYGSQDDQLSIFVSNDFDGVNELSNIEAATWHEITDSFPLPTTTNAVTPWGPLDISDYTGVNPVYIAFRYTFRPGQGVGRTWRIQSFNLTNMGGGSLMNQAEADFQLVFDGDVVESGRSSKSATLIQLRANSVNTTSPLVVWAISKALN